MLTRELALQRLRATGTLAGIARPRNAITRDEARDPVAQAVARIAASDLQRPGPRCLAPAANHQVLP